MEAAYDKSLAFLRSLGPEQEEPMDLSMKDTQTDEQEADVGSMEEEEERSSDSEDNELLQDNTGPPLDLTRKT